MITSRGCRLIVPAADAAVPSPQEPRGRRARRRPGWAEMMDLPDIDTVAEVLHEDWRAKILAAGITTRECAEDHSELMVPFAQLSQIGKELNRQPVRQVYEAIRQAQ